MVYWETIDFVWLETAPLAKVGGQRKFLNTHETTTGIEHYYFDTIKVDFAHITLDLVIIHSPKVPGTYKRVCYSSRLGNEVPGT
ncbi:MAG: hypothetical protein GY796_20015 [Chloroflexi bacterium]|nr:hypothetical protein [Chloroflexota bacterium]